MWAIHYARGLYAVILFFKQIGIIVHNVESARAKDHYCLPFAHMLNLRKKNIDQVGEKGRLQSRQSIFSDAPRLLNVLPYHHIAFRFVDGELLIAMVAVFALNP